MNRSFKFWMLGQGISQFGDWLYIVAIYWVIIGLDLKSWHGNLQGLVGAGVALAAGLLKLRLPRNWSPRAVMVGLMAYCALKSAFVAYLSHQQCLSFEILLVITVLSTLLGTLSAPSSTFFHLSLTGEKQHKATSWSDMLFWFSRFLVGVTVALALFGGVWTLFAIDAVSYAPLIVILLLVKLQYRDEKSEKDGATHSIWDGLKFARGDEKTKLLLLLNQTVICFIAVVFSLAAEVVRKDLGGGITAYGTMLAITGLVGLLGSFFTIWVVHQSPIFRSRVFVLASLATPLAAIGIGLSNSLLGFWVMYGIYCFVVCPRGTLTEAELRLAPREHQGGLTKLREILSRGVMPLVWFLVTFLGDLVGLSAKQIVSCSATVGFVLTVLILLKLATKPGLLSSLFAPRTDPSGS